MSQSPEIARRGIMLVVSSPSGAGKTTISRRLLERDSGLTLSISLTTRRMRPGEKDGVDYIFVDAARQLIAEGGAVGRKLDFLCQEFNREANTLCSKATDIELTRCGLALKSAVEQLREQVQNIE